MRIISLLFFYFLALSLTGCGTYNIKSGPELKDISNVPLPRGDGATINFSSKYNSGNFSLFSSNIEKTGLFSKTTYKQAQSASDQLFIDVEHWDYNTISGPKGALSVLFCGLTLCIFPTIGSWDQTWEVTVFDRNGKLLKEYKYWFDGYKTTTLWPWVFLFGASKNRVHGESYARFTSNLVYDLSKDGYLNK